MAHNLTWEDSFQQYNDDQFFTDADVNQDGTLTKEEIDDETQIMFAGAE